MSERNFSENKQLRANFGALAPILVFLAIYLGNGIYFEYVNPVEGKMGFYITSVVVSFGIALIVAFLQNRRLSFDDKIRACARGIGDANIVIMLLIFLLAGAFSGIAGAAGGASSAAHMLLNVIPADYALPGMFVIACIISIAMGTSVGTISVLAPVALAVVQAGNLPAPLFAAAVIGGAMFGDNLSFISDTTIAATNTQGVAMKDKFMANIRIALPAALATVAALVLVSANMGSSPVGHHDFSFLLALPYFLVFAMALMGINVFLVLITGIALFWALGITSGSLNYASAFESMGAGVSVYLPPRIFSPSRFSDCCPVSEEFSLVTF